MWECVFDRRGAQPRAAAVVPRCRGTFLLQGLSERESSGAFECAAGLQPDRKQRSRARFQAHDSKLAIATERNDLGGVHLLFG